MLLLDIVIIISYPCYVLFLLFLTIDMLAFQDDIAIYKQEYFYLIILNKTIYYLYLLIFGLFLIFILVLDLIDIFLLIFRMYVGNLIVYSFRILVLVLLAFFLAWRKISNCCRFRFDGLGCLVYLRFLYHLI